MEALWQDLRYAARRLAQSRGFSIVAILTLALGIGANTAIFQLLDAVRLRSLPVQAPQQLAEVLIKNHDGRRGNVSVWHAGATNAIWEQIRDRQEAFSGIFAWSPGGIRISPEGGEPRFASALLVSGEFFNVLGVRPQLGRLLAPQDDHRGCSAPGAVLSHAFWKKEFGGDPSVIGRKVTMGRYPYEVVGVAPPNFTGLEVGRRFDVVVPLCAEWLPPGSFNRLESGVDWWLIVMGRLKPGWNLEKASAHLASISPAVFDASLPANYPKENIREYRAFQLAAQDASSGISALREQYSASLWFLQVTAALVLLIGCANLANLMLARAAARDREISVRVALGAGRARLIRLLLAESLMLSIAGAIAGAWLADEMSRSLVNFLGGGLFLEMPLDWRLLGFASLAAMFTCALFGLVPALRATRVAPEAVLRGGGRGATDGRARFALRQGLVVSQVCLSLVLLAGAVLFARSLAHLMTQDLGLRPDGLTISYVDFSPLNVADERRAGFMREMLRQLEQMPGVVAAAETTNVPLSGSRSDNDVWVEGAAASQRSLSFFMHVSAGYFRTMDVPLLAGRRFDDDRDTPNAPRVALVNEAFARNFFAGANPVGKRFWREARTDDPETIYEIVGVVGNTKYWDVRQEFVPTAYVPISQEPPRQAFAQLLIRTSMPAATAVPTLRNTLRQMSAAIVPTFRDFRGMIDQSLVREQLVAGLSSFFGVLAVLLATIGLYGSISFAVARRTKEIGIRIALGAQKRGILRMILREAIVLVGMGCVARAALALALARTVSALVYGLQPNDPLTLISAALFLGSVSLAASLIPARRAAKLDPMAALRVE